MYSSPWFCKGLIVGSSRNLFSVSDSMPCVRLTAAVGNNQMSCLVSRALDNLMLPLIQFVIIIREALSSTEDSLPAAALPAASRLVRVATFMPNCKRAPAVLDQAPIQERYARSSSQLLLRNWRSDNCFLKFGCCARLFWCLRPCGRRKMHLSHDGRSSGQYRRMKRPKVTMVRFRVFLIFWGLRPSGSWSKVSERHSVKYILLANPNRVIFVMQVAKCQPSWSQI